MKDRSRESLDFVKHLRDEKLQTQTARTKYVTQKLAYATGLLALGSLKYGSNDLSRLLYLVPFLAVSFDLYILGEDYSVKRIGLFLRENSPVDLENGWEKWIARNRDHFAPFAMPILTNILALAAMFAILKNVNPALSWEEAFELMLTRWWWLVWLGFAFLSPWGLFVLYKRLLKRKSENKQEKATSDEERS